MMRKVYAVRRGRTFGIFYSWEDVKAAVEGFRGAEHKSFNSVPEAEEYLRQEQDGRQHQQGHGSHQGPPPSQPSINGIRQQAFNQQQQHFPLSGNQAVGMQQTVGRPQTIGDDHRCHLIIDALWERSLQVPGRTQADPNIMYTMNFDGASKGNPGAAGCSGVITDQSGNVVHELWASLPYGTTNNEAEYSGLVLGIYGALHIGVKRLKVLGDSQLIIRQLNKAYIVRNERLHQFYTVAVSALKQLRDWTADHVYREQNQRADKLANHAVDVQMR